MEAAEWHRVTRSARLTGNEGCRSPQGDAVSLWASVMGATCIDTPATSHRTASMVEAVRSRLCGDHSSTQSFETGLFGLEDYLGPTVNAFVEVLIGIRSIAEG